MFEESASNPSIWASMNSWFTPTVLFVLLNLMIGTILFSSSLSNQDQQQQQQEKQDQNDPQQPKLARSPSVLQRLKSINLYNFRSQESPPISSLSKQSLDSDTHYSSQQANQVQQTIESHTHYIFEETHQHETIITDTQFDFEQTHEETSPKTQTQFDFEQTHEAKSPKMQTLYVPEEIHSDEDGEPQSLDEVYSQLAQLSDRHVGRTTSDTKPSSGEVPTKLPQKMRKSASMKSAFGHFEESDIVENRRPATVREGEGRSAKATEADDEVDAKAGDFINKFKQQLKLQRLDSIIRYKELISRGSAK